MSILKDRQWDFYKWLLIFEFTSKYYTESIMNYTTFAKFSMKYLVMCNVYTDVGGMK